MKASVEGQVEGTMEKATLKKLEAWIGNALSEEFRAVLVRKGDGTYAVILE